MDSNNWTDEQKAKANELLNLGFPESLIEEALKYPLNPSNPDDLEELMDRVMQSCEPILKAQVALTHTMRSIYELNHGKISFLRRLKLMRSLTSTNELWAHIQVCSECKPVFDEFRKQVNTYKFKTE